MQRSRFVFKKSEKEYLKNALTGGKTCCFRWVLLPPAPPAPEQPNGILPTLKQYRWAEKKRRICPEGSGVVPRKLDAGTRVSLGVTGPGQRCLDIFGRTVQPRSSPPSLGPHGHLPPPPTAAPPHEGPPLSYSSSLSDHPLGNNHSWPFLSKPCPLRLWLKGQTS